MSGGFGAGPASLAPHPWGAIGKPPPLGAAYPDAVLAEGGVPFDVAEKAIKAAELLARADELREEAEEANHDANDRERKAKTILESLADWPRLVESIELDPASVWDRDSVTLAAKGTES